MPDLRPIAARRRRRREHLAVPALRAARRRSAPITSGTAGDRVLQAGDSMKMGVRDLLSFKSIGRLSHVRKIRLAEETNGRTPHQIERVRPKTCVRPGNRTRRMFSRRLKSNSFGRSRASGVKSRCPFAGCVADDHKRMHDTTLKDNIPGISKQQGRTATESAREHHPSPRQVRR